MQDRGFACLAVPDQETHIALRVGNFGLVFGPTAFFGTATLVRPFLGVRFDVPLARRERRP